jgi:quinoprotein glucose dehydrogenase
MNEKSNEAKMTVGRLASWLLGGFLILVGLWLGLGGAWLMSLGGSLYYVSAGAGCVISGILVCRRQKLGLWLYGLVFAATVIWAIAEVGFDFWLLLPRIGGPLVVALYMLMPWVRRALEPPSPKVTRSRDYRVARRPLRNIAVLGLLGLALLAGLRWSDVRTAADGTPATAQPATDWPVVGGTPAGTRFSPATQITPENVGKLKVAWTYRTGDLPANFPDSHSPQMFEAAPLKIGDTLYLCTPRNIVIALDADTGKERWRHDPKVDSTGVVTLACRGVSYYETAPETAADCPRRILVATVDARMIALNADTGGRCQSFGQNGEISLRTDMGPIKPGFYAVTSPPAIIGNAAVVGGFVLDNMGVDEPSGVVRAFDAIDGKLLWAWDSGRPESAGPHKPGETYTRGSANAWSLFSVDEKLGLVYIPTGNPTPDHYAAQRSPDMERYGSSVVALDGATGQVRWSFQTVHHDLWDYDVASQPVLIDMPIDGKQVPALIQPTKQGEVFILDRRDGHPIAPVEERPVAKGDIPGEHYSPTQPYSVAMPSFTPNPMREAEMWGTTPLDQLWCRIQFRKLKYDGKFTPPSLDTTLEFPGNNGIMNWGSVSVDEARQLMVVNTSYMPLTVRLIPRKDAPAGDRIVLDGSAAISPMAGTPYAVRTERPFLSPLGIPCNAPPWGELSAIDLTTRKILWRRPLGTTHDHAPLGISVPGVFNQGGSVTTAGSLVFIGAALDNYLRAFDLATGAELWKGRLPAGAQATPISFVSGHTGKQYVVIASGGHQFMHTTIGDYVVAYTLQD